LHSTTKHLPNFESGENLRSSNIVKFEFSLVVSGPLTAVLCDEISPKALTPHHTGGTRMLNSVRFCEYINLTEHW